MNRKLLNRIVRSAPVLSLAALLFAIGLLAGCAGVVMDANHGMMDSHMDEHMGTAGSDPMAAAMAHDIPAEAAAKQNPVGYDAESVAAGAELFQSTCAVCHGPEGRGDGPGAAGLNPKPADLSADHVQANSDGALFYTISEGRPGTAMIGWEETYNETQRWYLVNYIRSLAVQ